MGLPNVIINIENGALGGVISLADGIAGIIFTGVAASGLALNTPKQIFSLKDAENIGIDAAYDTSNTVNVHRHISDFYAQAGTGAELWIIIVPSTYSMATAFGTGEKVETLLTAAKGTIRIVGSAIVHNSGATLVGGLDGDVAAGVVAANALAVDYAEKMQPFVCVVSGNRWSGVAGDLTDLHTMSESKVGVVLAGIGSGKKEAAIGLVAGRLAAVPVQRNIGRVKSGHVGYTAAYLSDGATVESHDAALSAIHDKGYIIFRNFSGKSGYFFNDDLTATSLTDDYSSIARNRVIHKAMIIAYSVFVEEVNDEVVVNADGTLPTGYLQLLQSNIESQINNSMTAGGEISSVSCIIDAAQNVLSTNQLVVGLRVVPVGYSKEIIINLGFNNPATTA